MYQLHIILELNLDTIVWILSIGTTLMLGLYFLSSKTKNKKANIYLGAFLWSIGLEVFHSFIEPQDLGGFWIPQTNLLTVVLLFFYVNTTLNKPFKKGYLFLYLPWVLTNLLGIHSDDIRYAEYVFHLSLLFWIFKMVQNHQKALRDFYSDLENKTLSWIKMIVFLFVVFHVLWIIEDIYMWQGQSCTPYFAISSSILTLFMIYWIGYYGLSQAAMFNARLFAEPEVLLETPPERIEETEEITVEIPKETDQDMAPSHPNPEFMTVSQRIAKAQLFKRQDLDLRSLALALNMKEKELSRLINTHTKKNFYRFINEFRVEEFKKLLQSDKAEQMSLLGLSQEAGFSSKSTFYSVFKAAEGMTPKQYQMQLKKSE